MPPSFSLFQREANMKAYTGEAEIKAKLDELWEQRSKDRPYHSIGMKPADGPGETHEGLKIGDGRCSAVDGVWIYEFKQGADPILICESEINVLMVT